MLKAKLLVSIHIFKPLLQVKNYFKKRYIDNTIQSNLCPGLFFKCLKGSSDLPCVCLCSSILGTVFLMVSPM